MTRLRDFRAAGLLLTPGLLDSGFASLAGFSGSLYAARFLEPSALGVYALYFAAFQALGLLPERLLLLPSQVASLRSARSDRTSILPSTLAVGAMFSALAALLAPLTTIVVLGEAPGATLVAFALTTSGLLLLSPLQDHLRAVLHLSDRSWHAVGVSAAQLVAAVIAMAALHLGGAPTPWIPFGGLCVANLSSLPFGLFLVRHEIRVPRAELPPLRDLVRSGRALLVAGAVPAMATFVAAALVARLASTEALGHAEAARVVAMPVAVLAVGIDQVLGPRLMEAGQRGSRSSAMTVARVYLPAVLLFSVAYLMMTGWSHPANPMELLIPAAYAVPGLVLFRISAFAAISMTRIPSRLLLGAGRNRHLMIMGVSGAVASLASVALLASATGAYAIPAGHLTLAVASGGIGLAWLRKVLNRP